jgi:dienelactone hydrolase
LSRQHASGAEVATGTMPAVPAPRQRGAHRRRLTRRQRLGRTVTVAAIALLGLGALVSWAASGRPGAPHAGRTTITTLAPTSTTTSTTTTTTVPPVVPIGSYGVASVALAITEPPAAAGGAARSLLTTVWYPTSRAGAPYPLLVFSQGYDASVATYATLIRDWASAGFVVAGPTYPHTDPSSPSTLDENDIVNHPADLRFVVTTLLGDSAQGGSALSGMIRSSSIGVTGQSDGGDVSLAVVANSCCLDPRVKAAAILSGAEWAGLGGRWFPGPTVPVLAVQGTADTINPPGCSAQFYDADPSTKYWLSLLGAGHLPPYVDAGTDQEVVAKVTTDFFEAELAGRSAAVAAMAADGVVAGATSFGSTPTGPWAPGPCPGAPG